MTDKKTEALKPCEYCGHPLPQGVDKRTRQVRSHHFAACKVRLEQKALAEQPALTEQPAEQRPQNCGTGFCSCIECPYVQPAQQPVAWMYDTTLPDGEVITDWTSVAHPLDVTLPDENVHNIRPLYAAPPAIKSWAGLTSADRVEILRADGEAAVMLLTEAKLREKNA